MSESHSVGVTWTVGLDLGLGMSSLVKAVTKGGTADLSGSVSETVTDSVSETGNLQCPPGAWHCSLMIYPTVRRVKGHLELGDDCGEVLARSHDDLVGKPFELTIPLKSDKGNGLMDIEPCTCQNLKGWADPGHLERPCSQDCSPPGS